MSVARSSLWFTLGTLISRCTGLARDAVVTGVFGASTALEAFLVANRIPNLFREMLAEGALGSAFTKVYSQLAEEDQRRASRLLGDGLRLGCIVLVLLSVVGVFGAPWMVKLFTLSATERPQAFFDQAIGLTRLLFPFLGIAMLSAIVMGALHQSGRFFASAVSPALLNLGYICGALLFGSWLSGLGWAWIAEVLADPTVVGLALGVLLGGFLHFLVQFIVAIRKLRRQGIRLQFSSALISRDMRRVFVIMVPAAVAASTASFNVLVNTNFATSLETGAVTWLTYAFRLLQLPIGIFAVGVGAAALPALTRAVTAAGKSVDEQVNRELQNAIEFILWLMMPCWVFLLMNHLPAVQLLFQHGRFDAEAAEATSKALFAYSFGVLGYGLIKVLTSFYFAVERTAYAMRVSLVAVLVNLIANWLLVDLLGHVGLAATSAVTLSFNAFGLALGLKASGVVIDFPKFIKALNFMVLTGALAVLLQRFCLLAWSRLDLGDLLGLKLSAALILLANGCIVVVCYSGAAMIHLQWSFSDAIDKIKTFRR